MYGRIKSRMDVAQITRPGLSACRLSLGRLKPTLSGGSSDEWTSPIAAFRADRDGETPSLTETDTLRDAISLIAIWISPSSQGTIENESLAAPDRKSVV